MASEYFVEKIYTQKQLSDHILDLKQSLAESNKDSLISRIIGGALAGIGLWVTVPLTWSVGNIIASYFFETYLIISSESESRTEYAISCLQDILTTMVYGSYDMSKVNLAVEDLNGDGTILMAQGADLAALHKGSGWISQY